MDGESIEEFMCHDERHVVGIYERSAILIPSCQRCSILKGIDLIVSVHTIGSDVYLQML